MINAVDAIATSPTYPTRTAKTATARAAAPAGIADTVSISDDATRRLMAEQDARVAILRSNAAADAANPGSRWRLSSGLKEGTFTLDNGNTQTVKIDGDGLEIMEYRNGKLVKSVTGSLSETGASLDTSYYDENGKVSQAIHTDLEEMDERKGWTVARMRRSVQWFDDGRLTGDMQDSMLLSTRNSNDSVDAEGVDSRIRDLLADATGKAADSAADFNPDLTKENHIAKYYAEVTEYGLNGRLTRETTVEYEGRYEQLSNRADKKQYGMDARSTEEVSHDTGLTINVRNYDADGELVRDAAFSDSQQDNNYEATDGRQQQSMDVSWYSGGDLVRRSHGSMTVEETATAKLAGRPSILDTLHISADQYLGDAPQSAADLLAAGAVRGAQEPDTFLEGVERRAANGDYSTAAHIGEAQAADRPYAVDWTDELYSDGKLAQRTQHSESARETSFFQRERARMFRVGRGLTENDSPVVLRRTAHEHEVFEDGQVTQREQTKARESVEISAARPDRLVTSATMAQGPEGQETITAMRQDGGLDLMDPNLHAASQGMGSAVRVSLDDFRDNVRQMNAEDLSYRDGLRVRLGYRSRFAD